MRFRADTALGKVIPYLAPSTQKKRAFCFPSRSHKPSRKGAQIALKSGFESIAAAAIPGLFS